MTLQVGVKVALKGEDGRILLVRRAGKYGAIEGAWDIVGGRIEPGSSLAHNLEREVKEETGLVLATAPRLIAAQDIMPGDGRHIVRLTYVARAGGEPQLDTSENDAYQWLPFDELSAADPLDPYVRQLLDIGALRADSWG